MSTTVNLPRVHAPHYPRECVVCGRAEPDSHVRVMTGTLGWWTWVLWIFGRPFVARVPACGRCAWWLQGIRLASLLLTVGIAAATYLYVWPLFADAVPRRAHKWAIMGLFVVCLLPKLVVDVLFARAFDVTAYSDSVDYDFASRKYALQFALRNLDAEWVKLDDVDFRQLLDEADADSDPEGPDP